MLKNNFFTVPRGKIQTNVREYKQPGLVVVYHSNSYPSSYGCMANETSQEFLRSQKTCLDYLYLIN